MKILLSLLTVFILTLSPASGQLLIDFDNGGNQDGGFHTESGYQSYAANHEVPGDFVPVTYPVNFNLTGMASVTLTPAWPNTTAATVQQMIDRTADFDGNWLGNNVNLLTDWIGSDSRTGNGGNGDYDGTTGTPTIMTMTLSGVPAGLYDWTSFHHDTEHMNSFFTVELSTDGGATFTMIGEYRMTDSTPGGNPDSLNPIDGSMNPDPHNLPSTVNFQFATTGDDVVFRFIPLAQIAVHQQFFGMNGFELVQTGGNQTPKKILLVSDNIYSNSRAGMGDPEVEFQAFLESLGYDVIRATGEGANAQFTENQEGGAGAAAVGADLILVSGVANSGNYDADIASWNSIETPILLLSPHISRSSRWRWFDTATIIDLAGTDLQELVFVESNHPFVKGLNTDIFDAPGQFTRIGINNAGNGTVIATDAAGNVTLAEWPAGVEYYPGSGQVAAGRRVAFGRHRYHEDDPNGVPIQFELYSENGKAIIAQILADLLPQAGAGYQEPSGGWTYKYDGDVVDAGVGGFTALDGTWSHDNGSDEWDGSGIGAGSPGGASQLEDSGFDFIRIQDAGDPRNDGFPDPGSNRKVYFGHSVDADGVTGPILQDGFTLSFRARIATGDPLDPQTGGADWPTEGKGYLGHDGGKGNVTVRQAGVGTISFSLALASESPTGETGLNMNGLNGAAASGSVDPFQNEGTPNVLPMDDLTADWHEFWMNIVEDTTGGGTHRVDVFVDGSETETSYHVTAGTGSDFDGNYIAIGNGATPQMGAWDLDFIAYKEGIHLPRRQGTGSPVSFEEQPQSLTVLEGRPASFSVSILGTPPRTLQWQRSDDGGATFNDISGATDSTYAIDMVENSDNGAIFRVVGVNPIGTSTSLEATLTVIDDNEAPQIVSVTASANFRQVTIQMDEPLDLTIANDLILYLIQEANNPAVALGNAGLAFSEDATQIILTVEPAMNPDTLYTANVFFGSDLVGNFIQIPIAMNFRSFAFSPGFALREFYFLPSDVPNTLESLRNAPNYPNNPDMVDYSPLLEGPVNAFDNYGLRISGRLNPQESGLYDFFMSSDDNGEFWLNLIPDDNQPSNLTLIASEPVWNGSRDWIGTARRDPVNPENRSTTLFPDGIMLEAGRSYYFEALVKEGGGGDNLAVAAVPHGELPENGSTPITGNFYMTAPINTEGATIAITQQPQDALVNAGCILDPGTMPPTSMTAYPAPSGGWDYLYDGAGIQGQGVCHRSGNDPVPALDGTWVANNGSSEWDGSLRGAGNGMPGGISSDGDILTIEDINLGSGSCNNRKIYFTHDLGQDLAGLPENYLDAGVTLTFRTRLTQPDSDPMAEITTPDGWGIFSGGKGQFSVRQSNPSSIVSFSLVRDSEPDNNFAFSSAGLTMNRLNGDTPLNGEVNSSSSAANNQVMPVDPNEFHEFWITIEANDDTPGNGTHTVNIYVDGSLEPTTFNVTAGTGSDASGNYVAMGLNNSGGQAAVDIDFFGVKAGALPPPETGLFVDFDNAGNQDGGPHTEDGYQSYAANHEVAADFVTQTFEANFAVTGAATVSVTPTWPNTTDVRVQQMIDRGPGNDANWLGNNLNLLTDFLGTDTRTGSGGNGDYDGTSGTPTWLDLTLGGLPAGNYSWLSFHHDTENVHVPFTVEVSTDGGATFVQVGQYQMTDSTPGGNPDSGALLVDGSADPDPHNLSSTARFQFTATGGNVVVRFVPLAQVAVHQQIFGINGFELNQISATVTKPKILLVSDNVYSASRAGTGDPEVEFQGFLEGLGYDVIRASGEGGSAQFTESQEGGAGAAAVGADLIIISGVANSGNYDGDIAGWNTIETPILLLSPHISRNNRWKWFDSSAIVDDSIQDLVYVQPSHPFVAGLGTDIYDGPGPFTRIGTSSAGNGTVIATDAAGNVTLAEWAAGVEFYAGSGQFAGGRRVAFGRHRYHEDDPSGVPIPFELYSDNGKALLAQIINDLAPVGGSGPDPTDPELPVEFTVAADGMVAGGEDAVFLVQWQKNGVDIPGANGFTLNTTVTKADAGAEFRALLFVPGAMVTSDTATLIFNIAPEVAITSPEDGAVIPTGSAITITAAAMDSDGSVVSVEFFAEGVGTIGADTDGSDGWSVSVPNPAPGIYVLTAIATDNLGASCGSLPVMVELLDNTPPLANDDSAITDEDVSVIIDVLANDTDAEGDALTVSMKSGPANGAASVNPDGTVTYTPNANFNGTDAFTYAANDGAVDSDPATVTITVVPVNDPPTCAPGSGSGNEDEAIVIALTGADIDGDALVFTASNGANGTVTVSGNMATYTGNANYCGSDSFSFTVSDGSASASCDVTVTVNAVNDAPTGVVQVTPQADLGSTVSGIVVISADGETACINLDASQSFDIDADGDCGDGTIESYTWLDAAGNILGTGAVIEACLPVGPQAITLVVDDGETAGETVAVVEILTPCEAIEELIMQVEESVIERDNKRPFLATLKNACASFDRGSYGAALNRLSNAFQNKVQAQIAQDNPDVAEEWNRIAQVIIDAVGDYQP